MRKEIKLKLLKRRFYRGNIVRVIKGSSDLFEYDNEIEIFLNISKSKLYLKKLGNKNQNISFKKT